MRIKKHPSGNQYLLTEQNLWVRNFTSVVAPLDINQLSTKTDYSNYLKNEILNDRITALDFSSLKSSAAVIVSDGYNFKENHQVLKELSNSVSIIATNRSLVKWGINRKIDFFVVNNPYKECMNFLPNHRYYPKCIVSSKTYPQFVEEYQDKGGVVLSYTSTSDSNYASPRINVQLDDYRNPICAAINLAYKLGVTKLLLLGCDDSFDSERPAAIQLKNGLWTYPQHLISHGILNAMLYWYKKIKGVKIGNCSFGPFYEGVPYIPKEEVCKFFN
jgi:hypothetical protein